MRTELRPTHRKNVWVGFRATEPQMEKLIVLVQKTDMSLSGVLRTLVDAADIESVQRVVPTVRVANNEREKAHQ